MSDAFERGYLSRSITNANDLADARREAARYNGAYACRFCQHQVREHNRIEGCRFCTCAGNPSEASPQNDREWAVTPLSPSRQIKHYRVYPERYCRVHPQCTMPPGHTGPCCICGPGSATCRVGCPSRVEVNPITGKPIGARQATFTDFTINEVTSWLATHGGILQEAAYMTKSMAYLTERINAEVKRRLT